MLHFVLWTHFIISFNDSRGRQWIRRVSRRTLATQVKPKSKRIELQMHRTPRAAFFSFAGRNVSESTQLWVVARTAFHCHTQVLSTIDCISSLISFLHRLSLLRFSFESTDRTTDHRLERVNRGNERTFVYFFNKTFSSTEICSALQSITSKCDGRRRRWNNCTPLFVNSRIKFLLTNLIFLEHDLRFFFFLIISLFAHFHFFDSIFLIFTFFLASFTSICLSIGNCYVWEINKREKVMKKMVGNITKSNSFKRKKKKWIDVNCMEKNESVCNKFRVGCLVLST